MRDAMYGVSYIWHAAALKQVPSCEFFPMEAVRTNVIGTETSAAPHGRRFRRFRAEAARREQEKLAGKAKDSQKLFNAV